MNIESIELSFTSYKEYTLAQRVIDENAPSEVLESLDAGIVEHYGCKPYWSITINEPISIDCLKLLIDKINEQKRINYID